MTKFTGCIDLHNGQVKQIIGGTLSSNLQTNFTSSYPSSHYANLYKQNNIKSSHVIKLGPNNDEAAIEALQTWPDNLQIGGGINLDNCLFWLDKGASKVIVTSCLFNESKFDFEILRRLSEAVGTGRLVVDLSCKKTVSGYNVATNQWKTVTDTVISQESLSDIGLFCSEFLVHAVDVEGLCNGVDQELVKLLGLWSKIKCTYAGGAKDINDLSIVDRLSGGRVDLTYGSSLDIFGGTGVTFDELCKWNRKKDQE